MGFKVYHLLHKSHEIVHVVDCKVVRYVTAGKCTSMYAHNVVNVDGRHHYKI